MLFAFAVGAAVGAAVALLFAPATGEETREYLGERAREKDGTALPRPRDRVATWSIAAARR